MSTTKRRTKSNTEGAMKTERIAIRLTPEMKAKAEAAARSDSRSLSNWIEKMIREAVSGRTGE